MVPLVGTYVDAMDTHGSDGLGESFLPDVPGKFPEKPAVEFLERDAEKEETDILALGPLTNLARLFQKRPELIRRVPGLSQWEAASEATELFPVAEYNYWCDPEAAKICYELFAEAGKKIEMVGLDVTRKIVLTPNLISYMSVWIRRPADLSEDYRILHGFPLGIRGNYRLRDQ